MAWTWRGLVGMIWLGLALAGCNNSPYPDGAAAANTLYSAFTERSPRHLDPTASYWNNETPFTYNIYEPLYGYHFLKRPYQLAPKTALELVTPQYLDHTGRVLPADAPGASVAESVYEIRIRPGILFQPHPAFAVDGQGRHLYHHLSPAELADKDSPLAFAEQGTRELVADDYVYAIKRHTTTRITTPISGIFSEYVIGLKDYAELIRKEDAKLRQGLDPAQLDKPFLDFRRWPLAGASAPEKHLLRVRIRGKYPQWKYWMAMTFLAPIPWEADAFYAQTGMARNGMSLDRWPVGTGPYMMVESVQDRRHVLQRNPNYRGVPFPCDGSEADRAAGLLADCGKPTPFIDRLVFQIEKEGVSLKAKFRQGYLDVPQLERDDWGSALAVEMEDSDDIQREYTEKGFRLPRFVDMNMYYIGFNMLDPVVGMGQSPEQRQRNRKLRQAIAIAIDWDEHSRIFPKEAGETAMAPLPAGLFGSRHGKQEGINPVTHRWVDGKALRRPIEDAQRLMVEAGYPDGRDAASGKPLVLNYDFYGAPTPERKAEFDWLIKQFAKIGVQLEIRATDNNQFQDKVRRGKHQIYMSGWLADYPDAENFLFLLYGPNSKSKSDGENTSNYENPEFDARFNRLKFLDDGPAKQALIDEMVTILQEDAPWSWGFFPYSGGAYQHWVHNTNPSIVVRDHAKYFRLDTQERVRHQQAWNRSVYWPLLLLAAAAVWLVWLTRRSWRRHETATGRAGVQPPTMAKPEA